MVFGLESFKYHDPLGEGYPDLVENRIPGRHFAEGGGQSTNDHTNLEEIYSFFEAVPTQMSFIRSVGLDKQIIDISWIIGNPEINVSGGIGGDRVFKHQP